MTYMHKLNFSVRWFFKTSYLLRLPRLPLQIMRLPRLPPQIIHTAIIII